MAFVSHNPNHVDGQLACADYGRGGTRSVASAVGTDRLSQRRRGAEAEVMTENDITGDILDASIKLHRKFGPGSKGTNS